jgi:hypothetical protein
VSEYRTKHKTDGCNCKTIYPPLRAVEGALNNLTIPVISGLDLLNSELANAVQIYSPVNQMSFLAFSHVWSDGLGSTTEDGMPECQVEYLTEIALKVTGTPLFWIDSLHTARKRAISMMAETYKAAGFTVVLDSGIKNCDFKKSLETRMLALSLSTWQERLWTLQESSLSRNIVFVFENDIVLAETIAQESNAKIYRPVIMTMQILLDNLSNWSEDGRVTIGGLQRNLFRRTSSKPDDESLAVAPFLGIKVSQLLDVHGDERMARFWRGARLVPKSIILHNLPKIAQDGYRWAPKSLMNQKNAVILDLQDRSAIVTEDGLKGNYWIYKFHLPLTLVLHSEALFYDWQSNCLLRMIAHDSAMNLSISEEHVMILPDQVEPSTELFVGAILSQDVSRQGLMTYKYEGIVGGNLLSQSMFKELSGSDKDWSRTVNMAQGRVSSGWAEILIR